VPALHEHAENNIRYIRDAMERASSFTSIPGWGGLVIGFTAVVAAGFAQLFTRTNVWMWLTIWLTEAVIAGLIAGVTMYRKARRSNVSLTSKTSLRFFISYGAPVAAGAVLTFVLARVGALAVLPPLWLLLYGASIVSSGAFSVPIVRVMGICFMILGLIAAFVPFSAGNILVGAGFGGLHVVFGYLIARNYGG
jgi:hypothetical protein